MKNEFLCYLPKNYLFSYLQADLAKSLRKFIQTIFKVMIPFTFIVVVIVVVAVVAVVVYQINLPIVLS